MRKGLIFAVAGLCLEMGFFACSQLQTRDEEQVTDVSQASAKVRQACLDSNTENNTAACRKASRLFPADAEVEASQACRQADAFRKVARRKHGIEEGGDLSL